MPKMTKLERMMQSVLLLLKQMKTKTSVSMTWSRDQGNPTGQRGPLLLVSDQRNKCLSWNSSVLEWRKEWSPSSSGEGGVVACHLQRDVVYLKMYLPCWHDWEENVVTEETAKERRMKREKED